jgi:hypothetical protein
VAHACRHARTYHVLATALHPGARATRSSFGTSSRPSSRARGGRPARPSLTTSSVGWSQPWSKALTMVVIRNIDSSVSPVLMLFEPSLFWLRPSLDDQPSGSILLKPFLSS